jgi:hypothetical protein
MSTYFQPATIPPQTQPCPLCGAPVAKSERYPEAICAACVELAVDAQGRAVRFANESLLGHRRRARCACRPAKRAVDATQCFIRGVECHAAEAYFGVIVVRPVRRA